MTTLGIMKARIIQELDVSDLDNDDPLRTGIGDEITSAINFYRSRRFYFTEQRTQVTFNTVNAVDTYGSAANINIPDLIRIDSVILTRDGHVSGLRLLDQARMDAWLGSNSPLSGDPAYFSYYARLLRLYPRPDGAYPIQISGVIRVLAPATDGEADNVWMTDGEALIRTRAKKQLYAHWLHDAEMAQVSEVTEREELDRLLAETSSRTQVSRIIPECL